MNRHFLTPVVRVLSSSLLASAMVVNLSGCGGGTTTPAPVGSGQDDPDLTDPGADLGDGEPADCSFTDDGECDDGRPGSFTALCDAGTDEVDCEGTVASPNSCLFALDAQCDDGRPGAISSLCGFGTDESDCSGERVDCVFTEDGECDDGRPGSLTSLCPEGTDEVDCRGVIADPDGCLFAFDGQCDDGRDGTISSLCGPGTDEGDCDN